MRPPLVLNGAVTLNSFVMANKNPSDTYAKCKKLRKQSK